MAHSKKRALRATLGGVVNRSIIICHNERVDELYQTLAKEKLNPFVQRAKYNTIEEMKYSNQFKCFSGHRDAWKKTVDTQDYTLICEADFVPCSGLGRLPVFWPIEKSLAWGYLYQGSPRLLRISDAGHLRGHASPLVGYVINSDVAKIFLRFFDYQMAQYSPKDYFTFDAHLQWWAMGQGAEAYIPLRHYGEHGGNPQPEHRIFGVRLVGERRGGVHRADNLQGPLAFLPQYANGKRISFISQRTIARGYGWARLLCGRWISDVYSRSRWDTMKMHAIGLRRLLPGR